MTMDFNIKHSKHQNILSHEEMKIYIKKRQNGDTEARNVLVERNVRLVWSVVQRFINRGYDPDDLFQIGSIGLIKAIDKFDLSYEVRFSTYAVPMIIGEIQRFIRDDGTIKVSRTLKELGHKVRRKKEELTKQLKRSPTISEVAASLDVTPEEVVQAQEAIRYPHSIHETVYENGGEPITLLDQIAEEDIGWFDRLLLEEAINRLTEREQLIVYLRYFKDQTQTEVAKRLNISQVQVSRLEKKILQQMKEQMQRK